MRKKIIFLIVLILGCLNITGLIGAQDQETYLYVLNPQEPNLKTWPTGWGNEPDEVSARISDGNVVVRGIREEQSFGALHKNICVDFEKYSYLEIEVSRAANCWYIIFSGPEFENGFIRIQKDTEKTGKFKYNLWNYPQLRNKMEFDIQIGVSAPGKSGQKDVEMVFGNLRFVDTGRRRPLKGPKLIRRNLPQPILNANYDLPKPQISRIVFLSSHKQAPGKDFYKPKKNIFEIFARRELPVETPISRPVFNDTGKETISIESDCYKLIFSKKNGAFLGIKDKVKNEIISVGSVDGILWRLNFHKRKSISNKDFDSDSKERPFKYKWKKSKKQLLFSYEDKTTDFKFTITICASKENYIDFKTEIKNTYEQPIILVNFPKGLTFKLEKLKRFIYPFRGGLAFKPGFFLERRYISESQYLFSDYIAVEFENSNLSLYTIQNPKCWTQATMSAGYDSYQGGAGFYTYAQATYIKSSSRWRSPVIRMRIGEPTEESIQHYIEDNALNKIPDLNKRISKDLFYKLSKSVLLKFDFVWIGQSFKEVKEFIEKLPSPTLIHPVTFWDKGFDKNYPDYLPPNEDFGSQEDLRELVEAARELGDLVMPYTNPTWWNESVTLEKLGKENIAVIKLDGQIHGECYWGVNWGIITSPHHPQVIKRTQQTVREFKYDIPCDILFEDQLGSRPWQYDLNPRARGVNFYKQGLIDFARRDSKQIPVMCEGGFDGLMPYVIAFSDLSVNNALPPDETFNSWYGKGNWEVFPYALYVAHNKNGFYQHNLAHEVFTNSKEQLTWNMAYGHNLNQGYWPAAWEKEQKKWFYIDDAFQKAVACRFFGKKLTDFQRMGKEITFSRFEDIGIVANHSKVTPYEIEGFLLPPGGFLAKSQDDSLVAGIFDVFNHDLLADEHFIIVEKEPDKIIVKQPDAKKTLISLKRPDAWDMADRINVICGGQQVPTAVSEDKITFLYDSAEINSKYILNYDPLIDDIELIIKPEKNYVRPQEKVKVSVIAKNLSIMPIKEGKLALSAWLVHSDGPVPGMWGGYSQDKADITQVSEIFKAIDIDSQVLADFNIVIPEKAGEGDIIWLKGEIIYTQDSIRKMKQIQNKVNVISQPIKIQIRPKEIIIYPEVKEQLEIKIKNNQAKTLKGNIELDTDLPAGILEKESISFYLKPLEEKTIFVGVRVPASEVDEDYQLIAKVKLDGRMYSSSTCLIKVSLGMPEIGLGPQNVLFLSRKQPLNVTVQAHGGLPLKGWLNIEVPEGWQIMPEKQEVNLLAGKHKKFDFTIKPTSKIDTNIIAKISTDETEIKRQEAFKVIGERGEAVLIEADINQDGYTDFVLANKLVEVHVTEAIGGRILSFFLKEDAHNQLYNAYWQLPKTKEAKAWIEYGGINDWFPKEWPGEVWANTWEYEIKQKGPKEVSLKMWTQTPDKLYLERTMTLKAGSPVLNVKYKVKNNSSSKQEFAWANHPDLAPGPRDATEKHQIVIPTRDKGMIIQDYKRSISKNEYIPSENWILAHDGASDEYFLQEFDRKLVDKIGVWEGVGFYTMELVFKPKTLNPQEEFTFDIKYSAGKEKLENLKSGPLAVKMPYPPVEEKKYVFAHYMTWFGTPEVSNSWYNWAWPQKAHKRNPDRTLPGGRRDIASLHYPLIGPYDSTDEDVLEYHILLAKAAGINGFVVNWYNFEDKFGKVKHIDKGFKKLLEVSERLNFKVCVDIDDKCMFPPYTYGSTREQAINEAKKAVRRIFREYGRSEAYFRINGRLVITNFGWGPPLFSGEGAVSFSPQEWKEIMNSVKEFQPLFIADHQWHWGKGIGETGFLEVADSIYPWVSGGPQPRIEFYEQSKQALAEGQIEFISGEACPGFDSYGTWGWGGGRTIIPRDEGEVYKTTWDECLKYDVKWIQIITWNDFAEGSTIEPTLEYGYKYLEITADYAFGLNNKKPNYYALKIPKEIYDIKSQIKELSENEKINLDLLNLYKRDCKEAVALFVNGNYKKASQIVNNLKQKVKREKIKIPEIKETELLLKPQEATIFAGETQNFFVLIRNESDEFLKGKLNIDSDGDIPANWLSKNTVDIDLRAGEEIKIPFQINVSQKAKKRKAMIEAKLETGEKLIRSHVSLVKITPSFFHIDIGPLNILRLKKKEKILVQITTQQKNSDSGNIILNVPSGWIVKPRKASYTIKGTGKKKIDFFITPTNTKEGTITAMVTSRNKGELSASEPFKVIEKTDAALAKGDINADGRIDFVLGNSKVEIQITPALGGRILAFYLRQTGNNQLFLDYPGVEKTIDSAFEGWIEYGGINDTFPRGWPGEVWANTWEYEIKQKGPKEVSLKMWTQTPDKLYLERTMTLKAGSPVLNVKYKVKNNSSSKQEFAWANHPDLAPGSSKKAQLEDEIIIPARSGLIKESFRAIMGKSHHSPSEGWCVALSSKTGEYFAQQFDRDLVKNIGVWQGKDFFTVELIFKEILLQPNEEVSFNVNYLAGKDDWMQAIKYSAEEESSQDLLKR